MKERLITKPAILLLFFLSCTTPPAESPSSKAKIIEEYITRMADLGEFNGNVLVAEKGQVIYRRAIGQRSVKVGDLLDLGAQFRLASASKPFTAMAIMLLKEAGKLDYEDPVKKYIPEWPYEGATIRNLLNHTSGIPNHKVLFGEHWKPRLREDNPERIIEGSEQMIQMFIDHQPEVYFQPGERYGYSDTGYILLSCIVERVSGIPFHQYMRENVFLPAGMVDTYVFSPLREDPLTNRAYGIMPAPDGSGLKSRDFHYLSPLVGANGVYSTLEDLYRWDRILYTEQLVSASALEEAFAPGVLSNGETTAYGFGWSIHKTSSGGRIVSHSGYSQGFGIEIIRELDEEIAIIILTNYDLYLWAGVIQNLRRILDGRGYELPKQSIAKVFSPTLLTEGIKIARQQYFELKQSRAADYDFGENALNELGIVLRRENYMEESLLVLEFNAEEYPQSAIVWNSLGDHYLAVGDEAKAIANYRKALEIDPDFSRSQEKLAVLERMNRDD